jgi:hypothetical protein
MHSLRSDRNWFGRTLAVAATLFAIVATQACARVTAAPPIEAQRDPIAAVHDDRPTLSHDLFAAAVRGR